MPKQPQMIAQVTALLVAQDVFQDRDERKRTHIIGVFDSIGAPKFPVNLSFKVYCKISGEGTHTAVVRIDDSLGDRVVESGPMVVEVTPQKAHELFLGFGATFRGPGLYRVMAFLDGIKELEQPLYVREEVPEKARPSS